jgi:hypothetical protein
VAASDLRARDRVGLVQSDEDEGEVEHLAQRIGQGADNLRRLPAPPQDRERHHADEIVWTAAQSRPFVGGGLERRIHLSGGGWATDPPLLSVPKFGQELFRRDEERIPQKNSADDDQRMRP